MPVKLSDVTGDCVADIGDVTKMITHLFITFEELEDGCDPVNAVEGKPVSTLKK